MCEIIVVRYLWIHRAWGVGDIGTRSSSIQCRVPHSPHVACNCDIAGSYCCRDRNPEVDVGGAGVRSRLTVAENKLSDDTLYMIELYMKEDSDME